MRFLSIKKDTPYEKFLEIAKKKISGVILIKDTDGFIVRAPTDPYWFVYSKTAPLFGSETYDPVLREKMRANGYDKHWAILDGECDYNNAMGKLAKLPVSTNTTKREELKRIFAGVHKKKQTVPEYGVELELESSSRFSTVEQNDLTNVSKLIDNVGSDPSVHGGCEIRFNHPALSGWKYKEIKMVMNKAKELGAKTDLGTAGMHIHISRPDIKEIVKKFEDNKHVMQEILYPINCRKQKIKRGEDLYYGVGNNIFRNQLSDFGTLEIRAWNATLDAKLFLARIKFCKYFCDWLAKTKKITVDSFFESLTPENKRNYEYMANHKENPHEWGMPLKAVNAMLA